MKELLFLKNTLWKQKVQEDILTTIISEGSNTMHSQPRLKLPAERLPKLERGEQKKKKKHSDTKNHELGIQANLQPQKKF